MGFFRGLSGRLLLLTVLVVMLAEVLIFVPSVARFRFDYLQERLRRAEIAVLTVMAAPEGMVSAELQRQLLDRAEVVNVVVEGMGERAMVLSGPEMPTVSASFDLRDPSPLALIRDAFARLVGVEDGAVIRVIGAIEGMEYRTIEITVPAAPLRRAMAAYGWRILQLSLVISLVTAAVVFWAVRGAVVTPILRLVRGVRRFQAAPEDPGAVIRPQSRVGEIAEAEQAIAEMQRELQRSLAERARLAELGEAVAKISHDLRNILSAGQMMADRLGMSADPTVARVLPKLIASLDRAIRLCQRTLAHGRAEEAPPVPRTVSLRRLVDEVVEAQGLDTGEAPARCRIEVAPGHTVRADPEQLYRVLANLVRNAAEAIQASGRPGEIVLSAETAAEGEVIRVRDTGPGMPSSAVEHLFQPFRGGARAGGAGLGLSIARELVQAQGGRLELVSSTTEGTEFAITLPAAGPSTAVAASPA
ncbi:MAG TPA: HAMP domain-containing sensor histidine kinase [Thermohalobaculum sp.]|nr:HAMP domain-containing sensor histidine kinase [Thermohalobaculum sp.]